jgi:signal transduction histidine kinase
LDRPDRGAAEERSQNVWEMTSDLAFSTRVLGDGSMVVEWITEALARDFDVDPGAPTKLGVFSLVHQLDVPEALRALEVLASGREFVGELRLTARDGAVRWTRFYARPVRDPDTGKLVQIHGALHDITGRKHAEVRLDRTIDVLRRTAEERRQLVSRLVGAQEEEARERDAGPVSEDPVLAMTLAARRLGSLTREIEDPGQAAALRRVDEMVGQAVDQLRLLLVELRPPELDSDGLAAAVWVYMEQARAEAGIDYRLENKMRFEPDEATRVLLYRILQEALGNVRKHSRADHVEVLIESRDGGVFVRIWDDGLGFSKHEVEPPRPGALGIPSMRERAEMAGGWCRVDSLPALGTRVEFWVPMAASADDDDADEDRGDRRERRTEPWPALMPRAWSG